MGSVRNDRFLFLPRAGGGVWRERRGEEKGKIVVKRRERTEE